MKSAMKWAEKLRRAILAHRQQEEEMEDMATNNYPDANGYNKDVDSSSWEQPVASHKGGEPQPAPAPTEMTDTGSRRTPTPDPYTTDNPHVRRNFGRS